MRNRLVLAALPVALLGVAVASASAAPKPMTGSYAATAPVPGGAVACDGTVPQSLHSQEVELPAAGKLVVDLTGFTGDWDLFVSSKGSVLGAAETGGVGGVDEALEKVSIKIKRATVVSIDSCNWAGGPTGAVEWTFTPNK